MPSAPAVRVVPSRSATRRLLRLLGTLAAMIPSFAQPVEAASQQAVDAAIDRGRNYLLTVRPRRFSDDGYSSLRLYALLKAKAAKDDPTVVELIKLVESHFPGGVYSPGVGSHEKTYCAGVDAMILLELDKEKYTPQLIMIRDYLLGQQLENGGFNYTGTMTNNGDTSVTQYAMLGLWAVSRAGIDVPDGAFQACARWHAETRQRDGGHAYNPNPRNSKSTLNMTVSAVGSLGICKLFFAEEQETPGESREEQLRAAAAQPAEVTPDAPPVRYGLLTPIVPEPEEEQPKDERPRDPIEVPETLDRFEETSISRAQASKLMRPALGWIDARFQVRRTGQFASYYYYSLERAGTLSDREEFGGSDWFEACSDYLVSTQNSNGAWTMDARHDADTAFCLLFLTRSTQQLVGKKRKKAEDRYGGGLLIGGRGLPKDLTQFGKAEPKKVRIQTPLEKLLADLANADESSLPEIQEKLVEEIQLGDHSVLIGQSDKLVEMTTNPRGDVRRVAAWAIGRTGELTLARHVLPLFDDPDPAVLTEARNAMAWIARRPDAYGVPEYPPAEDPQLQQWRDDAWRKWGRWYLEQSPYGGRLDEYELDLKRRLDQLR